MVGMGEFEIIELDFEGRKVLCSIKRSKKARRISLRILSKQEVALVVPQRANLADAKKFLQSKLDWVNKKTAGMPDIHDLSKYLEENPKVWVDSRPRDLEVNFTNFRKKTTHEIQGDLIKVTIVENEQKEDCLLQFMLNLAKIYLPLRLEECAQKVGVCFSKTRVGNQKTRWGSCSSAKVISLNWRILLLDYEIGEYVLYHELAHLKHMNHSQKYWDLLSRWVGDARGLDRQLSWQGRELMLLARN